MKRINVAFYIYLTILAILFGLIIEQIFRHKGYVPWTDNRSNILRVDPGGKFYRRDPLLGYTHLPGIFKITLLDGYQFICTHREDNLLRITHPIEIKKSIKPEIWLFGCSFTYGWAVNDNETSGWLLQEKMPNYEIVNFGTTGYGTLQSFLQFKQAVKLKKPEKVILFYASFHDERNTFSRNRQKVVRAYRGFGPLIQPFARVGRGNELVYEMATMEYKELPLMKYSAFFHWLEMKFNKVEDIFLQSNQISKMLIIEFNNLCKEQNIEFMVAGIYSDLKTREMLRYCDERGIKVVDISVDLSKKENTNLPADNHPSALAHKKYAERVLNAIS